jgi:8-oxo-dGTP pyrophosphatase MutT (NUDIX family)
MSQRLKRRSKNHGSRTVFKSYVFRVVEKQVDIGGIRRTIHIVEGTPATRVMAVDGDSLVLIRQKRLKIRGARELIEIPGGSINTAAKETPAKNAARELAEETGIVAKRILRLSPAAYIKDPGSGPGVFHFFLADGLRKAKMQKLDSEESIKVIRLKLKQAVKMVETGKIDDLATAFAVLYYNQFKSGKSK